MKCIYATNFACNHFDGEYLNNTEYDCKYPCGQKKWWTDFNHPKSLYSPKTKTFVNVNKIRS